MAVKHPTRPHRRRRPHRKQPGTPPGTLVADPNALRPTITVIGYGPDDHVEARIEDPEQLREHLARWPITWVNVDGLGDVRTIEHIGRIFGLHPLALEDVLNVQQRPKIEPYGEHLFIVTRMIVHEDPSPLETEQIGLFLGRGFVITFQERPGDPLEQVRERIRRGGVRVRFMGADYLAYAILDAVVDAYFPVLEAYGERIEALEDQVLFDAVDGAVSRIHRIKRDLLTIRRTMWPTRDLLQGLGRDPSDLVSEETRVYVRDAHDHAVRILDLVETYRELGSDLLNVYLTSTSNRTNEVMRVLTVIATIFIPLTFITGLYGMNFDPDASRWNMPELEWAYGYPAVLLVCAVVVAGLLWFFRRRGWLGERDAQPVRRLPPSASGSSTRERGT